MTSCIHCGNDLAFHRVLLTEGEERVIGELCLECETEIFGRSFADKVWQKDDGCNFCGGTIHVNIPLLQCHIEYLDGADEYEYDSPASAPSLCQHHFTKFLMDTSEEVDVPTLKAPS